MSKGEANELILLVFLVLLGLLVLGLVGGYFLDMFSRSGTGLQNAAACTSIKVYPVSCKYTSSGSTVDLAVKATYDRSEGQARIKDINLLFTSNSGDVVRVASTSLPNASEASEVYRVSGLSSRAYTSISVVSVVVPQNTDIETTCSPSQSIECK